MSLLSVSLAVAAAFRLDVAVTPSGAGSLYMSPDDTGGVYESGASIYLDISPNSGFVFQGWYEGDNLVSIERWFYYKMPAHDTRLEARFIYDPKTPADPEVQGPYYNLELVSRPAGGGTFNRERYTMTAGETTSLYAYTNAGFRFVGWEDEAGQQLSADYWYSYTMPANDARVYGVFEYDPELPSNPAANHWDSETGEVILDDFRPGRLTDALWTVVNDRDQVSTIIVQGRMDSNDFGIANYCPNVSLIDLSRVTGISKVPSWGFDYSNAQSMLLPADIEEIEQYAFYYCEKLTSLTVFAMAPPQVGYDAFTGVPDGLVVYVPAASVSQYQEAETWRDFTILPIQQDIRNLTVALPAGVQPADYAQMWLELTNTKNGQKMHYVMTDRPAYTFASVIRNTTWNVTLRNERGDVFGQIDGVEVKDDDVTVTFTSVAKPQTLALKVLTPEGDDVTTQSRITWLDAEGNYLTQGNQLTSMLSGTSLQYEVALSQQEAMTCLAPDIASCTVGNNSLVICQLEAIPTVTVQGVVKDAASRIALGGVLVSVSQTYGNRYPQTLTTTTDSKGNYSLRLRTVPTALTYSMSDYVQETIDCTALLAGQSEITLPNTLLKPITGAVISVGFSYTNSVAAGQTAETDAWYSAPENVGYTIYNITRGQEIGRFSAQYPQIVLLEEVSEGDVLELTATSRTNAFMPVTAQANIDANQHGEVIFDILQLGKVTAHYGKTANASVVAAIYDGSQTLVSTQRYTSGGRVTFDDLKDGAYTLLSMGESQLYKDFSDLSQLTETGLIRDVDYMLNAVTVQSGRITDVEIDEVPVFDESKLYYTSSNTNVTVNKPTVVVGNYQTISSTVDFKPEYRDGVEDASLVFDLPASVSFVDNSVMAGTTLSSYTLNGNRLTVPLQTLSERVRFCVIPTQGGTCQPNAFVEFTYQGVTRMQPIGNALFQAENFVISAPAAVASPRFTVKGAAPKGAEVTLYADQDVLGTTTASPIGEWSLDVELPSPVNLNTYQLHTVIRTKEGLELTSESVSCLYDQNRIEAKTVEMSFFNAWMHKTVSVTFDLQHATASESSYSFYTTTDVTFVADLTNNDPEVVREVGILVYTDQDNWKALPAQYDSKIDRWVAVASFGSGELPIGVEVAVDATTETVIDDATLTGIMDSLNGINDEMQDELNQLDNLPDIQGLLSNGSSMQQIYAQYCALLGIEPQTPDETAVEARFAELDAMTEAEMLAAIDRVIADLDAQFATIEDEQDDVDLDQIFAFADGMFDFSSLGMTDIKIEKIEGLIDETALLADGFASFSTTGGGIVYCKAVEDIVELYDMLNLLHISYRQTESAFLAHGRGRQLEGGDWLTIITNAKDMVATITDYYLKITEKLNGLIARASASANCARNIADNSLFELVGVSKLEQKYGFPSLTSRMNALRNRFDKATSIATKYMAKSKFWKYVKYGGKALGGCFNIAALINDLNSYIHDMQAWVSLRDSIRALAEKCDHYNPVLNDANFKGHTILVGYLGVIGLDLSSIISLFSSVATGGFSAILSVAGSITGGVGGIMLPRQSAQYKQEVKDELAAVEPCEPCSCKFGKPCVCPADACVCPTCNVCQCSNGKACTCKPTKCTCRKCHPRPPLIITPIHDPSGYVYEAVSSNRLEGVTATAFYKEEVEDMYGDLHEEIVKWDAEEYAQKNPLFTDEFGMYAWDVPQGMWQVKFEKAGYETTYSDWLPVPPPQLEVNIAMTTRVQPTVRMAHAYETAVEIEFDKYMDPATLTAENIYVLVNDEAVSGAVVLLDEEVSYAGQAEAYASRVRLEYAQPFEATEVTLVVSRRVESYAGVRMEADFMQAFTVEREVQQIVCQETAYVDYGGTTTLQLDVLPAEAAAGKVLHVATSSAMIVDVTTPDVTIDAEGHAFVTLSGELPGTAGLTFSLEGSKRRASTIVNVISEDYKLVEAPRATIASGSTVTRGTTVALTTANAQAVIYYTIDGSSPYNEQTRLRYTSPIVIDRPMTIRAIAEVPGGYASQLVELTYFVEGQGIEVVAQDQPAQVTYYDMQGHRVETPRPGSFVIVRMQMPNGEVRSSKVLVR